MAIYIVMVIVTNFIVTFFEWWKIQFDPFGSIWTDVIKMWRLFKELWSQFQLGLFSPRPVERDGSRLRLFPHSHVLQGDHGQGHVRGGLCRPVELTGNLSRGIVDLSVVAWSVVQGPKQSLWLRYVINEWVMSSKPVCLLSPSVLLFFLHLRGQLSIQNPYF